jgi:sterol desaturase/sphingolipid hydroxylase (fatty acid hydroxylase superfamily)
MSFLGLLGPEQWAARYGSGTRLAAEEVPIAFIRYVTIPAYAAIVLACLIVAAVTVSDGWQIAAPLIVVVLVYPFVEYVLHRYALHSQLFYRLPATSKLWRRLHYDHHMAPDDLSVLFAAFYSTLPLIFVIATVPGYLLFGVPGAAAATAGGFLALMFYEFFHLSAHLPWHTSSRILRRMRRYHLLHHYHNESGNYGIVTNVVDRLVASFYRSRGGIAHSDTVRNLGYTASVAKRFPWVAKSIEAERRGS